MVAMMMAPFPMTADAQDEITGKEKKEVVKEIVAGYKNWNKAGFQAKVKMDLLPVDLTMKVYMEKGKLTLISLRAPFIGEAARIEMDKDSVLLVNKLKKRYCSLPLDDVERAIPNVMDYVQSTLLGRIVIAGYGQLSTSNAKYMTLLSGSDSIYLAVPDMPEGVNGTYGYQLDAEKLLTMIMMAWGSPDTVVDDNGNEVYAFKASLTIPIEYRRNRIYAGVELQFRDRLYTAELEADPVEWGAKGFDRFTLGRGYSRGSVKEVMRF